MRPLISFPFIIAATVLFCHGWFLKDEAQATFATANTPAAWSAVTTANPYSPAAQEAHTQLIKTWGKAAPEVSSDRATSIALARFQAGIKDTAPWVNPASAATLAIFGLLLAVFLPRQRGRSIVLLLALAGALVTSPLLMDDGTQAELISSFTPIEFLIIHQGLIAIGLLFLAGLFLSLARPQAIYHRDER